MGKKDAHNLRCYPKIAKSNSGRSDEGRIAVVVSLIDPRPSIENSRNRLGLNCYCGYHQGGPTRFIGGIHVLPSLQRSPNLSRVARAGRVHQLIHSRLDAIVGVLPNEHLVLQILTSTHLRTGNK
jgi:hypothetical protein